MPEGQVSHRNALRMTAALGGRDVTEVEVGDPRIAPQGIPARLAGDRIDFVEAAGKHHLFRFASGRVLHSHLGMVGRWRLLDASRPTPRTGLWLAITAGEHVAAQYGGPRLRLYEPGASIPGLSSLGPDLLGADVDPAAVTRERLASADPGYSVGEALLDQRIVSGIGNIVRSETLFLCGVDPARPLGSVTPDEAATLGETAARILADGVRAGGPIITYRSPNPRNRERTWVYGRAGRPCRRCGTPIRSLTTGDQGRTVYWCPVCQG